MSQGREGLRLPRPFRSRRGDDSLGVGHRLGPFLPERGCFDRLKLVWIADDHSLRTGLRDGFDEHSHLPRRNHTGSSRTKDRLVVKLGTALRSDEQVIFTAGNAP